MQNPYFNERYYILEYRNGLYRFTVENKAGASGYTNSYEMNFVGGNDFD